MQRKKVKKDKICNSRTHFWLIQNLGPWFTLIESFNASFFYASVLTYVESEIWRMQQWKCIKIPPSLVFLLANCFRFFCTLRLFLAFTSLWNWLTVFNVVLWNIIHVYVIREVSFSRASVLRAFLHERWSELTLYLAVKRKERRKCVCWRNSTSKKSPETRKLF